MKNEQAFLEFIRTFKDYIIQFVRDNSPKLKIFEIEVGEMPITLFKDQDSLLRIIVKNQGLKPVFLTTDKKTKFRLDPGEYHDLHINVPLTFICFDGITEVSFIQS